MGRSSALSLVAAIGLMLAGCGGGDEESELGKEAQAACTGTPLSSASNLPASFPQIEAES